MPGGSDGPICRSLGASMDRHVPEEVLKCEEFIDRKMKPSLVRATAERYDFRLHIVTARSC